MKTKKIECILRNSIFLKDNVIYNNSDENVCPVYEVKLTPNKMDNHDVLVHPNDGFGEMSVEPKKAKYFEISEEMKEKMKKTKEIEKEKN